MNVAVSRAIIVAALLLHAVPAPLQAEQPGRVYRVGLVSPVAASAQHQAFRQKLHELGYVEGRNLIVEARFAEGQPDRIPALVAQMIRLKVDVLVVGATTATVAAKKATTTVPIVFGGVADPVSAGLVQSLARPGGNITGISMAIEDRFAGKWLELLKEAVPTLSRAAVLVNPAAPPTQGYMKALDAAAKALNVKLEVVTFAPGDRAWLDDAFAAISATGAQGVVVPAEPSLFAYRARLVHLAASKRLPAVYWARAIADDGGLMVYGPSLEDAYRQVARQVDKILKGAKPADLPVEQPTRFELVINMKAARELGLRIPQSLLQRADHVIE